MNSETKNTTAINRKLGYFTEFSLGSNVFVFINSKNQTPESIIMALLYR